MNESIVWLYQREAHDLNNCGIKAAELARLDPVPAGFVIIASAVGEARRSGRLPSDLRTEIMHAYHRLIIFGGTYLPFVKLVASPVVTSDEIPSPIILQLGGKAVLTKIEEMLHGADPSVPFAIVVQQRQPVLRLRPYTGAERERCMAIFQSNIPPYFFQNEEKAFADFLDVPNCPYYVAERSGEIVGCGGYWIDTEKQMAGMVWGMVRRDRQKDGVGTFLLLNRLQGIAIQLTNCTVHLDTSQHTFTFFQKFGFDVQKISENYYGEGLHRYDMTLQIDAERRNWITKSLGKYSG